MITSPIYTSEPMMTRALAAEVRHTPAGLTALLEQKMRLPAGDLGRLTDVACEKGGRIDVLLGYNRDGEELRVGIEAKFDHEITVEQLVRESAEVDRLVLLVLDASDAADYARNVDAVLTWAEMIACFPDSRVTQWDVDARPLTKVVVERLLRRQDLPGRLPEEWKADIRRGGGGMPSVVIQSPPLPDGRELRGQVQTVGRKLPSTLEDTLFEYHIAIEVNDDTGDDYPEPEAAKSEPDWLGHLRTLEALLDAPGRNESFLTRRPAGAGGGVYGVNKIPLVDKFLGEEKRWLARGYCDWALGIKSRKVSQDELFALCDEAVTIFTDWFAAETPGSGGRGQKVPGIPPTLP